MLTEVEAAVTNRPLTYMEGADYPGAVLPLTHTYTTEASYSHFPTADVTMMLTSIRASTRLTTNNDSLTGA